MNLNRMLQEESIPYDLLKEDATMSASEAFSDSMISIINKDDLAQMVDAQKHMLSRFEKTNEMLQNFVALSATRYATTVNEFNEHTQLLTGMKQDLSVIFKKIRTLKNKLSQSYPEAFSACSNVYDLLEDGDDDHQGAALNLETDTLGSLPGTSETQSGMLNHDTQVRKGKSSEEKGPKHPHTTPQDMPGASTRVIRERKHRSAKSRSRPRSEPVMEAMREPSGGEVKFLVGSEETTSGSSEQNDDKHMAPPVGDRTEPEGRADQPS